MIDKNNNITLIFFLLCVIFIVYYYDKHYKIRIKNLNNKIESFTDKNLLTVDENVKKELENMERIKTKFDYLFKNEDIDKEIYVKKEDDKIVDYIVVDKVYFEYHQVV